MQDQTTIRRATVDDAPRIADIHVRTAQRAFRAHVPAHILAAITIEDRLERWTECTGRQQPGASVWVAEDEGVVVGFCFVEPSREDDATPATGLLKSLYVDPAAAGRGIGTALMQTGLKSLAECGFHDATLWVIEANERAQTFYRHRGWEPDGAVRTEEQDGFTFRELRMRRTTLTPATPRPEGTRRSAGEGGERSS